MPWPAGDTMEIFQDRGSAEARSNPRITGVKIPFDTLSIYIGRSCMKDNQRIVITKRMLKEGLLRLLKTKTLDKISIVELCNEAGINRTTFYRHYEFPKDVLAEMQVEFLEEMMRPLKKPLSETDLEYVFDYFYKNSELVKLFIRYNSASEWTRMFTNLYQNTFSTQFLKTLDPESQRLFYAYHAGGIYFLLRQWLMDDNKKTPKEVYALILDMINKQYSF